MYGDIHREALKTLPDKITTTSHHRYVLASFRREKDRLHEQIQSDWDLVAAMDATLDALKPFIDKGKGRDRGQYRIIVDFTSTIDYFLHWTV